jgi:hypothetical protein
VQAKLFVHHTGNVFDVLSWGSEQNDFCLIGNG